MTEKFRGIGLQRCDSATGEGLDSLHIARLPDRKRVALYFHFGNTIEPLAYFMTEDKARRCARWLERGMLASGVQDGRPKDRDQ